MRQVVLSDTFQLAKTQSFMKFTFQAHTHIINSKDFKCKNPNRLPKKHLRK